VVLYSWYITDYTEVILFNNVVIMGYFTHGILLIILGFFLFNNIVITDHMLLYSWLLLLIIVNVILLVISIIFIGEYQGLQNNGLKH